MTATLVHPAGVASVPHAPVPEPVSGTTRWRRPALVGVVLALLAVEGWQVGPTLTGAVASLLTVGPGWCVVALLAAAGSMSAFARSRRRLLSAAGVRVPARSAVAAVYVANALHVTLPGGAAFSTAYTYRWLRSRGASAPVATWTLASGGVLASVTLAGLALLGSLLAGSGAGWGSLVAGVVGVVAATLAVRSLQRSPRTVVVIGRWAVQRVNVLRRRPPTAGLDRVDEMFTELRAVRPRGRDWVVATAFAAANWAFDAACLAAAAAALGVSGLSLSLLLLAYAAGMAASSLSLLPGGLGVVDAALVLTLVAGGIPAASALPAVLLYRLISLGGVVTVGWMVAAVQGVRGSAPA